MSLKSSLSFSSISASSILYYMSEQKQKGPQPEANKLSKKQQKALKIEDKKKEEALRPVKK